jgi:hypothetical protein
MIKYKTNEGKIITDNYGFDIKTGERSPTFEITKPMKEEYNVKTGSNSSFRMSGLVQASITVCGDETIAPIGDKLIKITRKQSKTSKYSIIAPDEYSKWFKLGFDGGSDKCIISNAVVEDLLDQKVSGGSIFINEKT